MYLLWLWLFYGQKWLSCVINSFEKSDFPNFFLHLPCVIN
nr:MAG TPA: hypothetical protein [Bacteriophage sp.]